MKRPKDWRQRATIATPEPILFLTKVAGVLDVYQRGRGGYPSEWQDVNVTFYYPFGHVGDPDVRPSLSQGPRWRPRNCHFTYVIQEATGSHFLIQAISDAGHAEYELEEGMDRPRAVSTIAPLFMRCAPPPSDGYEQSDERARRLGVDPLLSLTARFELTDRELVLVYTVENRGARDAYLMTPILWEGRDIGDRDEIYVNLEHDIKTVWLNKRVPAIPEGVNPLEPVYPSQTPLRAGTRFTETVRIPLPITPLNVHPEAPRSKDVVLYEGVRFTLQYYWRTEGMTEDVRTTVFGGRKFITRGGVPLTDSDHGFLQTEVVPMQVPVVEVR